MAKIQIFNCCKRKKHRKHKPDRLVIRMKTGLQSFIEGAKLMARLTFEEQVEVSVAPVTAKGNPARLDGPVVWGTTDPAVFTVTSLTDTSALVVAVGVGVAQLTADADADLDMGEERVLHGSAAIEVVEAEAVNMEINFGTPVTQP